MSSFDGLVEKKRKGWITRLDRHAKANVFNWFGRERIHTSKKMYTFIRDILNLFYTVTTTQPLLFLPKAPQHNKVTPWWILYILFYS